MSDSESEKLAAGTDVSQSGWSSDEDGSYSSLESNPQLDTLVEALKMKDQWKFASSFAGTHLQ